MIDTSTKSSSPARPHPPSPRSNALQRVDRALASDVELGPNCGADPGVILGYVSGRTPNLRRLVVGAGAFFRSGTVVYAGTTIGNGLQTGHHVVIREENRIGDNLNIWNNSTIDYGCQIGSNVKIHTNVYVAQFTTIEDDVFLAPGVTIANDPRPGCPHAKDCMRGPTIKRGAQLGCNVTVLPYVTIGARALIGAGTVVTKDVPDGAVVVGNPGHAINVVDELRCPIDRHDGHCLRSQAHE